MRDAERDWKITMTRKVRTMGQKVRSLRRVEIYLLLFITAGMVVERKPCVRGKMSENAMRRSKATACML